MRKLKSKKGFTLIELLAVVIILGILMTVGGLAVTRITEGTRKNTFVNTAQEYAEAVRTLWTSDAIYCGNNNFISSDVADGDYYILIDSKDPKFNYLLEKNNKSSWGNRDLKGYVRVNVSTNAKGKRDVKYYISITDGIHAITDDKEADKLKKGDLEMDISKDKEKLESINKTPFDIGSLTTCGESGMGHDQKEIAKVAEVIKGNKNDLKINDEIKINSEEFYVINSNRNSVTLLAKYKLYVGGVWEFGLTDDGDFVDRFKPYGPEATGLQDSSVLGYTQFSFYPGTGTNYHGSRVEKYVNDYKQKLEEFGATVNEARIISYDELTSLGCEDHYCDNSKLGPALNAFSYWTSTPYSDEYMWVVDGNSNYDRTSEYIFNYNRYSVRPVIVIPKASLK